MSNLPVRFYNNLGNLCKSKYIKIENDLLTDSYIKEIGLPEYLRKNMTLAVPCLVLKPKVPLLEFEISSNSILIENKTVHSFSILNNTKKEKKINLRFFSNQSDIEDIIAIKIFKLKPHTFLKVAFWFVRIVFVALALFVLLNTNQNFFNLNISININNWFSIPITFIVGIFVFSKRVYRFFQTLKIFQGKSSKILIKEIIDNKLVIKTLKSERDLSILSRLVQKQKIEILNNLFISQLDSSLSYEFLFPELYIDSPISTKKKFKKDLSRLNEYCMENLDSNKNILLIGNAGYGKTINAIKIYLDSAELFLKNLTPPVPLFLHINSIDFNVTNSDNILEQVFARYNIDFQLIKSKEVTIDDFIFIIDALDEIKNKLEIGVINKLRKSIIFTQCWNVSTSRIDFFEKYLNNNDFTNSFYDIINLLEWDYTNEGSSLISKIFLKQDKQDKIEEFKEFIENNNLTQIIDSPLILTMLIFIWLNNQVIDLHANKFVLYESFFNFWIKRELKRNNIDEILSPEIIKFYQNISWAVFTNPHITNKGILSKISQNEHSDSITEYISNINNFNLFIPDRNAFTHESFKEWLISKLIIESIIEESKNLKHILSTETTLAITTFVRIAAQILPVDKLEHISKVLRNMYYENLEINDSATIYLRKNACYFLSRINTQLAINFIIEILENIENEQIKEKPFVIGTILSGFVTIKGHYDIEQRYLSKLNNDSELDIRNRKYHLAYYGDTVVSNLQDFEKDIIKTNDDWEKTRKVLLKRIGSKDLRDQYLRTLDLITIKRFLETRIKTSLKISEILSIVKVDRRYKDLDKEKVKIIRNERRKLIIVTFKHMVNNIWK